jgi:hypothetical protein
LGQKDKSRGLCLVPLEIRLRREGVIRLGHKDISRGPCAYP